MTTIFNFGIRRILYLFYQQKKQSIHLREILRRTGISGRGLLQYLQILEQEKILSSHKQGNMKLYTVVPAKRTFSIFTLFDVEKERTLTQRRKDALSAYIQMLPEQPVFVILFGSTAKGTAKEESDVDILLITNKKIKTKDAEKEADILYAIKISTFQMVYKDFLKELKLKDDPVVQSALKTGFPILNHIAYYEAMYYERI